MGSDEVAISSEEDMIVGAVLLPSWGPSKPTQKASTSARGLREKGCYVKVRAQY